MTQEALPITEDMPLTPVAGELSPTFQMTQAVLPESGIRIEYSGKLSTRLVLGKLRPRVQRQQKHLSCGSEEEQARNLVVEGDNLQVMASLYRYGGQIDLVLADPPYNTGNDFRYNDRWEYDPNDPDPGPLLTSLIHKDYKYLVARDVAQNGYFLVWDGPETRTVLNMQIFAAIVQEARAEGLSAPYHVYARTSHVQTPNLFFYKIPDEILNKIGFNDAFGMGEDE